MASVYRKLVEIQKNSGAGYIVLIDPDRFDLDELGKRTRLISKYADLIFVGGSICVRHDFSDAVKVIKSNSSVPVVIFPGDVTQISKYADALLFLSLLSGRNPNLLIGEHVKAAPILKRTEIEVIPVGYILVEGGNLSSVQFMSQTLPIPSAKTEIAIAHALAGEYLGMKLIFLEAGSGASQPVSVEMVRGVSSAISVPLIVGGGIKQAEVAAELVEAGASFIVTGDIIEKNFDEGALERFKKAIHRT